MRISFIIPSMNGETVLPETLRELSSALTNIDEVVVVVNGTTDGTIKLLETTSDAWKKESDFPNLVIAKSEQGIGLALATGVTLARGRFIALSADDLPFGLSDWIEASNLDNPASLIIGSKAHKDSRVERSFARKTATFVFWLLRRVILGTKVGDTQGTFFVSGDWIRDYANISTEKGFIWTTHLTVYAEKRGLSVREVPVSLRPRHGVHSSRVRLRDFISGIAGLLRVRRAIQLSLMKDLRVDTELVLKKFPPPK